MTVAIDEADLAQLRVQFPELDFSDAERQTLLTRMDSIDVQAVPGSGKTTLLAAKLALISSKWLYSNRGVCVLSHTNVAREEIEKRLSIGTDGQRLLSHPHFIGTIQTFVHTFFALPLLRSFGISLDVIDDDYFAEQALASVTYKYPNLKVWHMNAPNKVEPIVKTLTFLGADLDVGCVGVSMPKDTIKSHPELCNIKKELAEKGIFRYDDMFAFTDYVLTNFPEIAAAVRHRFPLVFLDEMQDTSGAQEALLNSIFGAAVSIQRYGDVSQRILNDSDEEGACSFPKSGFLNVATSKRFGSEIAVVASRIRATGDAITGEGMEPATPPTMLLYEDDTIQNVISLFGTNVAELFTNEELANGTVKAVCARRTGSSNKGLGRHIIDYFPAFDVAVGKPASTRPAFFDLLHEVKMLRRDGEGLAPAVHLARTAVFQLVRHTDSQHTAKARGWWDFTVAVEKSGLSILEATELVRTLVLNPPCTDTEEHWATVKRALFESLAGYLPSTMSEAQFLDLAYLAYRNVDLEVVPAVGQGRPGNRLQITHAGKSFHIDVSTIAGVKGETHLATLVLESFLQSKFDVTNVLAYLCGEKESTTITSGNLYKQMRNLFVGMTRPTRHLCLAMHRGRLSSEYEAKLVGNGWRIQNCLMP